jgi:hypothetical protein
VTPYGSIYKLRRVTQIIAPEHDIAWLREIENDLGLVMQPDIASRSREVRSGSDSRHQRG